MSKTAMRALARRATRYGYQHIDACTASVTCPRCAARVTASKLAWERWTLGRWDAAFTAHQDECDEAAP